MNIETSPEIQQEQQQNPEITPVESARYFDRLDPHYENLWETLQANIQPAGVKDSKVMHMIWRDEAMPQIFCDRALLALYGSKSTVNRFYGGSDDVWESLSDGEKTRLYDWINETDVYQKESGIEIISDHALLRWRCDMFENDYLNEDEFDTYVASIESLIDLLPKSDSDDYAYDTDRFVLVSEIIDKKHYRGGGWGGDSYSTFRGPKMRAWAQKQLNRWFESKLDPSVELPHWYADIPNRSALRLWNCDEFTWEDRWPLIQHFSWGAFVRDGDGNVISALDSLTNVEMKQSLLHYFFDKFEEPKSDEDYPKLGNSYMSNNPTRLIDRFAQHAEEVGDEEILRRIAVDREQTVRHARAQQEKLKTDREIREQEYKKTAKYRSEIAAKQRLNNIMDALKQ